MKIYDITQEVVSCQVFPGDPKPSLEQVQSISDGASCNVSNLSMCVHNGTHLDAPYHFINEGKTMESLDLKKCIGKAAVVRINGEITAETITAVFTGRETNPAYQRILFKGAIHMTLDGARQLNHYGVVLAGCESQSIAPMDNAAEIHRELLGSEMVLLEGLVLEEIPTAEAIAMDIYADEYYLYAVPLKLAGSDGSPCRALLISDPDNN